MLTKHFILVLLLCAFACTSAAKTVVEGSSTLIPHEDDSQDDGNGFDDCGNTNRAPGLGMGGITGNVGAGGGSDLRGLGGIGGGAGGGIGARLGFGAGPDGGLQAGLGGGLGGDADASIGLGGDGGRLGGRPPAGSSGTGVVGGAAT